MNEQQALLDGGLVIESASEKNEDPISSLAERLDFLDIQILRKFYTTGKEFPYDTQPYCFPLLYKHMKEAHHLKIGLEALRKRLGVLVGCGFLLKAKNSNPVCYLPVGGREQFVRALIMKFFLINGITSFL